MDSAPSPRGFGRIKGEAPGPLGEMPFDGAGRNFATTRSRAITGTVLQISVKQETGSPGIAGLFATSLFFPLVVSLMLYLLPLAILYLVVRSRLGLPLSTAG